MANKFLKSSFSSVAISSVAMTQLVTMLPANNVSADGFWAWLCNFFSFRWLFGYSNEGVKEAISEQLTDNDVFSEMKKCFGKFKSIKFLEGYSGKIDFGEYKLPFSLQTSEGGYFMDNNGGYKRCLVYELCVGGSDVACIYNEDLNVRENLEKRLGEAYQRFERWYEGVCSNLKKIDGLVKANRLRVKSFDEKNGNLFLVPARGTQIKMVKKEGVTHSCDLLRYSFSSKNICFIETNYYGDYLYQYGTFFESEKIFDSMLSKNGEENSFNKRFEIEIY